jgi:hypothetical protein
MLKRPALLVLDQALAVLQNRMSTSFDRRTFVQFGRD